MDNADSGMPLLDAFSLFASPEERGLIPHGLLSREAPSATDLKRLQKLVARWLDAVRAHQCAVSAILDGRRQALKFQDIANAELQLPELSIRQDEKRYQDVRITLAEPLSRTESFHGAAIDEGGLSLWEAFRACGSERELELLDEYARFSRPPIFYVADCILPDEIGHRAWWQRAKPLNERLMNKLRSGECYIDGIEQPVTLSSERKTLSRVVLDHACFSLPDNEATVGAINVTDLKVYLTPRNRSSDLELVWSTPFPSDVQDGSSSGPTPTPGNKVEYSIEGKVVCVYLASGPTYFKQQQSKVLLALHQARIDGKAAMRPSSLAKASGVSSRVQDLFRNHEWPEFIEHKDGLFRLSASYRARA